MPANRWTVALTYPTPAVAPDPAGRFVSRLEQAGLHTPVVTYSPDGTTVTIFGHLDATTADAAVDNAAHAIAAADVTGTFGPAMSHRSEPVVDTPAVPADRGRQSTYGG